VCQPRISKSSIEGDFLPDPLWKFDPVVWAGEFDFSKHQTDIAPQELIN